MIFSLNTKLPVLDSTHSFTTTKIGTLRILQIKKVPFVKVSFERAAILEEIYLNRNNMQTILAYIDTQTCTFIKVQLV